MGGGASKTTLEVFSGKTREARLTFGHYYISVKGLAREKLPKRLKLLLLLLLQRPTYTRAGQVRSLISRKKGGKLFLPLPGWIDASTHNCHFPGYSFSLLLIGFSNHTVLVLLPPFSGFSHGVCGRSIKVRLWPNLFRTTSFSSSSSSIVSPFQNRSRLLRQFKVKLAIFFVFSGKLKGGSGNP